MNGRRRGGRGRPDSGISACVVIDKPAGMTSHDVVDRLRRVLGTRKVGHAGTLDPDATGVLVLGVGTGTKLLQFVTGADKTYAAEVVLGVETDTLDAAGSVVATHHMTCSPEQVAAAAAALTGDIEQIPPMVSAVRIDGRRLHELAREGKEIDRPPRSVTVHRFTTEPTDDPLVYRIEVECSSGTYVRTLAADLGTALGGGAHLRALRRCAVGSFTLDDAADLADFEAQGTVPGARPGMLPVADLLRGMARIEVDDDVAAQVSHGRSLGPIPGTGRLAVVGRDGTVLAVYEAREGELRPVKVLTGSS